MRSNRRLNPRSSGPQTSRPAIASLSGNGRMVQRLNSRRSRFHSRRSSLEGPDSPQNDDDDDDDQSFSDSPERKMFEPMASDAVSARALQPAGKSTSSSGGLRAAMGRLSLLTGVTSTRTIGNSTTGTVGTAPMSNLSRKPQQRQARPTKRQLQYQIQQADKGMGTLRDSELRDYEAPLSGQPSGRMRRSRASKKLKKLSNRNMARKDRGALGFRDDTIQAGGKDGTRTRRATSYTSIKLLGGSYIDDSDEESVPSPAVTTSAAINVNVPSAMELLHRSEAVNLSDKSVKQIHNSNRSALSRLGKSVEKVRPNLNNRPSDSTQQVSNASRRASYSFQGDGSTAFCHTFHSGTASGGSEVDDRSSAAAISTASRIVDALQNNFHRLVEAEYVDDHKTHNDIEQIQPLPRLQEQQRRLPLEEEWGKDVSSFDEPEESPMKIPDEEVLMREKSVKSGASKAFHKDAGKGRKSKKGKADGGHQYGRNRDRLKRADSSTHFDTMQNAGVRRSPLAEEASTKTIATGPTMPHRRSSLEVGEKVGNPHGRPLRPGNSESARRIRRTVTTINPNQSGETNGTSVERRKTWGGEESEEGGGGNADSSVVPSRALRNSFEHSERRSRKSKRLAETAAERTEADENASFVSALTGTTGLYPIETLKDAPRQDVRVVAFNPDGSTASPNYDTIAVEEGIWKHVSGLLEDCLSIADDGSVRSGTVVSEAATEMRSITSRLTRRSHDWDLISQVGAGDGGSKSRSGSCGDNELDEVRMARTALSSSANFFHDSASTNFKSATFHENQPRSSVGVRTSPPLQKDRSHSPSTLSKREAFKISHPALSATRKRSDISKHNKEFVSPRSVLRQSLLEISCRSMNSATNQNEISRIAAESEEELWVRQCLSRMKDAALGKIAMDVFSDVLVESTPGGIKAAIEKIAVTPIKGKHLDVSEEKKALLFGPHLTLFEIFRWSLQINIDHMANAVNVEHENHKKQEIERSLEQSLDKSDKSLKDRNSLEHEPDVSTKEDRTPDILGTQTANYVGSSADKDTHLSETILSAAIQLGLVAADRDKAKEEVSSSDPCNDVSSPPLGANGAESPIQRSTYNNNSSSVRFALPKNERASRSAIERLQEEYGPVYGIETQDKGPITAKRTLQPPRSDHAASLIDSLKKMRSTSKICDAQSSSASGAAGQDLATPSEVLLSPSSTRPSGLELAAFATAHLSMHYSDSDSDSDSSAVTTDTQTIAISATAMEHIFNPKIGKDKLVRPSSPGNVSNFSGSAGTKSGEQPQVDVLVSCATGIADSSLSMPSTLKEYA